MEIDEYNYNKSYMEWICEYLIEDFYPMIKCFNFEDKSPRRIHIDIFDADRNKIEFFTSDIFMNFLKEIESLLTKNKEPLIEDPLLITENIMRETSILFNRANNNDFPKNLDSGGLFFALHGLGTYLFHSGQFFQCNECNKYLPYKKFLTSEKIFNEKCDYCIDCYSGANYSIVKK